MGKDSRRYKAPSRSVRSSFPARAIIITSPGFLFFCSMTGRKRFAEPAEDGDGTVRQDQGHAKTSRLRGHVNKGEPFRFRASIFPPLRKRAYPNDNKVNVESSHVSENGTFHAPRCSPSSSFDDACSSPNKDPRRVCACAARPRPRPFPSPDCRAVLAASSPLSPVSTLPAVLPAAAPALFFSPGAAEPRRAPSTWVAVIAGEPANVEPDWFALGRGRGAPTRLRVLWRLLGG